ncbi:MAG: thioesterase family protein [Bacteroidales bacterium]|nr:thioesterase family protein [Bacteroidales bacterium]
MKNQLKTGIKGEHTMTVRIKDTASQYGSGLIDVFATPAMVGLMETTAQKSVQKFLPEGHITLGIEISVKHIKATPVGQKVTCFSELTHIDDRKLTFSLTAFDENDEIGSGTHQRFIVDKDKFLKKIKL